MATVEDRLAELGLRLPDVAKPAGAYVPARATGHLVYTAGQLPTVGGKSEGENRKRQVSVTSMYYLAQVNRPHRP